MDVSNPNVRAGLHLTIADLKAAHQSSILANAPAIKVRLAARRARRHTGAVDSTERQLTTAEINLLLSSHTRRRPGNVRLRKSLKKENRPAIKAGACLAWKPPASFLGPFGEPLVATGPMAESNPFRFSTKYHDAETGLLYYGLRYYQPIAGRWLSPDPITENGGMNLYAMVSNDSVNRVDMLGLEEVKCEKKADIGNVQIEMSVKIWDALKPEPDQDSKNMNYTKHALGAVQSAGKVATSAVSSATTFSIPSLFNSWHAKVYIKYKCCRCKDEKKYYFGKSNYIEEDVTSDLAGGFYRLDLNGDKYPQDARDVIDKMTKEASTKCGKYKKD